MNESITSIVPIECTHCKKQLLVAMNIFAPQVKTVTSPEEIAEAKSEAKKKIEALKLPDESNTEINKWLDSEETILLNADVEPLMEQIKKQNGITETVKTN